MQHFASYLPAQHSRICDLLSWLSYWIPAPAWLPALLAEIVALVLLQTDPGHGHHSNTSFIVSSDGLSCSLGFLMQLLPQTYRTPGFRDPAEHTDFACSRWKNIKILIMVTKQLVSRTRVGFKVIQQKTTQSDTLLTVILFIFLDQIACLCWNPHQVLPTCSSLAVTWGYWPHVPISYKAECW